VTPTVLAATVDIPAVELDRMTDDGAPPQQAAASSMNAWYRQLGVSHQQRDEAAGHEARTRHDRDHARQLALRRRWPGIVAAMRALSDGYNEGIGFKVLTVIANDENGDLIVKVVQRGGRTLTLTMVGAELCVSTSPATEGAPDDGKRWITYGSSDEATAAYALQHWLTQL
jgi:hypothetical protein